MDHITELRTHLQSTLAPVCRPLHEFIEEAHNRAVPHLHEYGITEPGWELTHLMRAHLSAQLHDEIAPGYTIREPRINGRMLVDCPDGSTLRILHMGAGGQIPAPGRNIARIRYYQQQLQLPNLGLASALLALWAVDEGGVGAFRIVRPVGRWRHGGRARIDLDMVLPREADQMEELEFRPDDEAFVFDLPISEEMVDDFAPREWR